MSHLKERKENNCLNCNAIINGKFCQICGQENVETKESAWNLITHFFEDITHFDGKFFSSLKLLITKPGFLSREYMLGRRASYLNPVRMYIFTSAIFFLIFFSFLKTKDTSIIQINSSQNGKTYEQTLKMDSLAFDAFTKNINKQNGKGAVPMSREMYKIYFDSSVDHSGVQFTPGKYKTKSDYDSIIALGKKNHTWLERKLVYKQIEINNKFKGNAKEGIKVFSEIFFHSLPQMFFISLPIFAFLLKLLYVRRKQFYYVSHGIFSIHIYVFTFIVMFVTLSFNKINESLHWTSLIVFRNIVTVAIFFYLYKAMRNFYQQSRGKTVLKYLLLYLLFLIAIAILFIIFIFFSLFKL